MLSDGSVTRWLDLLKRGDRAAARPLWERYFHLLVDRARTALRTGPRRAADEEDVALNAFDSFFRGVERGRFPKLGNRDDLWMILLMLTAQKTAHQVRDELREKRGGGRVRPESDLPGAGPEEEEGVLAGKLSTEPSPEFAAQCAEECRRLLDMLPTDELRNVAVWRMEGYTVEEIAAKIGRVPRTVHLKLAEIRDRWSGEGGSP